MTTFLLIDLSSLAYPIWHQNQTNADPTATVTQTLARIRALASGQPHVAICCDSPRSLRREADPTYKAQRPTRDANLIHQIQVIQDACRADGFPVWTADGFEADDVIASARAWIGAQGGNATTVVVSADKDLLQLVSDTVFDTVCVQRNGTRYDAAAVQAEYGVVPAQMADYLTLVGDASDNIKGAEGIGPKRAAAMLAKHGTLEGIYQALTEHATQFTPSTATALREFEPRVDAVRNLVRLRTDAVVPFTEIAAERAPMAVPAPSTAPPMAPMEDEMGGDMTHDEVTEMAATVAQVGQTAAEFTAAAQAIADAAPPITPPKPKPAPPAEPERVLTGTLVPFERQLEPVNFSQARTLALDLHESRMFSAYGTPQAVLTTVLAGRELGMQAMASLRAFHIVDGKPTLAADAIRALVHKSGKAKQFRCTERSATACTFIGQRVGEDTPMTMTYTIEEARKAWTKGDAKFNESGWGKFPADMLVARCSSKMARLIWPDVVFGLYDPNELDGVL